MERVARFVIRNNRKILIFSVLVTVLMGILAANITLKTSISDLLSDDDPMIVEMENAYKNFGGINTIIVGVEGERQNIEKYIENIHDELENVKNVKSVIYKNDTDFIDKNILLMSKEGEYEAMKKIIYSESITDFFRSMNEMFLSSNSLNAKSDSLNYEEKVYVANMLTDFNRLMTGIKEGNLTEEDIINIGSQFIHSNPYNISLDGKLGLIMVIPEISGDDIFQTNELVNTLESTAKNTAEKYEVKTSLSGTLVLQRDEMVTSEKDMGISGVVSLVLVVLVLLVSFKKIKLPLLSVIPLIMGVIWALGLTKLAIGYLDMFSAMMAAILIGLGIDFGVHIISTYTETFQKEGNERAVISVFKKSVRGIIAGGLTTAVGFTVFAFSSFQGFRNFGIVMGLGIICTIIAYLFVLPSLLIRCGNVKNYGNTKLFPTRWLKIPRWITLCTIIVLAIVFISRIGNLQFETNLLKLQAEGLEGIILNEKMQEKFDFSADNFFIVDDNLNEARLSAEKLEDSENFSKIDSVTKFIPTEEVQNEKLTDLRSLKEKINAREGFSKDIIDMNSFKIELNKFRGSIALLRIYAKSKSMPIVVEKCDDILNNEIFANIMNLNVENVLSVQIPLIETLDNIARNLNTEKLIDINSLPAVIKNNYIGEDGSIKTNLMPKGNVYSDVNTEKYTQEIEAMGKSIVGTPAMYMRIVKLASQEGQRLFIWLVILIFIIVFVDLKNIKYSILAIIPMLFSILFTMGMTNLIGLKLDLINMITFPLIIAIGIDDGIHFIHRYLVERDIAKTVATVGRAITITSLTTICAFGSFMLAQYKGLQSFGIFLAIGISFAYLLTITLLPVLISLVDRKKMYISEK